MKSFVSLAQNPLRTLRLKLSSSFTVVFLIYIFLSSCNSEKPVSYVDPFICTLGDHGHWPPAALVPFGLAELCPDTWPGSLTADGDFAHSGYDYSDNHIRGFSHFHRGSSGGTSIGDRAGLISVLPYSGKPADSLFLNPVVEIDKKSETARAGYYSVLMPHDGIKAELTASAHCGFHRYHFKQAEGNRLFITQGNRGGKDGISAKLTGKNCVEGSYGNKYFVMVFDSPVAGSFIWNGREQVQGETISGIDDGGLICEFGKLKGNELNIRVGLSLVSVEGARKNLEAEGSEKDFEKISEEAAAKWNKVLANIIVEGSSREDKTIFYTALYHSCFLPVNQTDVDGTYPGLDQQNHIAKGYIHYDGYAFWDSFRTTFPLYSLFLPAVDADIASSLKDIYEQADNWGSLPGSDHSPHGPIFKAAGKGGYQIFASCRHEHMLMVVADAYFKNIINYDIKQVYPYMMKEALLQMPAKYDSTGYIPARPDQTGEYSWDNHILAQVAISIPNEKDYEYLMKRAEYWRNTWDTSIKFFRARAAGGKWLDFPEDPAMNREKYTYEGSKWQWRWNVIHDIPALISEFGGSDEFVSQLEYFFEHDLYTAGNQIDLQAPFLFNIAGEPWLTQKWVHKLLKEPVTQKYGTHNLFKTPLFRKIYTATPDGYIEEMDDDYGCMAAWFNMSAMGLYQVCTGDPVYQLTAPIFDKVTIKLDKSFYKGKQFVIRAKNLSDKNIYIQSATLNGKPWNKSSIRHYEIADGGELVYEMGPEPNRSWGN